MRRGSWSQKPCIRDLCSATSVRCEQNRNAVCESARKRRWQRPSPCGRARGAGSRRPDESLDTLRARIWRRSTEVAEVAQRAGSRRRTAPARTTPREVSDLAQAATRLQVRAGAVAERRQVLAGRLEDVEKRLSGHAEDGGTPRRRRRRIVADTLPSSASQGVVEVSPGESRVRRRQLQELRDRQVEMLRAGGARLEDLSQAPSRDRREARLGSATTTRSYDVELAELGARHQAATEALDRELDC